MKLSELLDARVVDERGRELRRVQDVHLVPDGPLVPGFGAALRADKLLVGRGAMGVRLGFHRDAMKGPLPLKVFFRWLLRQAEPIEWSRVLQYEDGEVRVSGR
ncbi:MAG: hypothetical protein LC792_03875 [Actinobacteria bacterium]|nr:hypothetical protein [Actinomycetota bacterium]